MPNALVQLSGKVARDPGEEFEVVADRVRRSGDGWWERAQLLRRRGVFAAEVNAVRDDRRRSIGDHPPLSALPRPDHDRDPRRLAQLDGRTKART